MGGKGVDACSPLAPEDATGRMSLMCPGGPTHILRCDLALEGLEGLLEDLKTPLYHRQPPCLSQTETHPIVQISLSESEESVFDSAQEALNSVIDSLGLR